ncbi:alanine racemase [Alkaliphilus peptidifermentans]|uniref:D-serine deaminase, pyridoxal phosphate-dependent n=1 Tax=Alkaliphilus peptidifermentans DSM 18978 TaxID=1120976 RepID=A0A1G5IWQ7_9FIRM|nr:alanine racemase [Alkaliphilus peptidifermentans]SCY80160.1 D-serine deaminase, pyridoxal phosphate-dependent [Alkaliphilus peptidifermentans DSM 18978]
MDIKNLETPCLVVDLDKLERNIEEMQRLADHHGVELWPMIKTHKSSYIVEKQMEAGGKGILTAKLSEAEKMVEANVKRIILAYPIIGENKLQRLIDLTKKAEIYCSIDSIAAATILNEKGIEAGIIFKCIIIVDSGLKRLGITPNTAGEFYRTIRNLSNVKIVGVATHGGHVYGAINKDDVKRAAREEINAVEVAAQQLQKEGINCEIIAIGSTPTVMAIENFGLIKQIRPGNYVFYDAVQVALGVVPEERCALSILATVISVPEEDRAIIDAGSKILCLDAGAHGNNNIVGYGRIKGKGSITVKGLSEELGKLQYDPKEISLKVGEIIEIIPNHACTAANMLDKIYGVRNGRVETEIIVSARGMVY